MARKESFEHLCAVACEYARTPVKDIGPVSDRLYEAAAACAMESEQERHHTDPPCELCDEKKQRQRVDEMPARVDALAERLQIMSRAIEFLSAATTDRTTILDRNHWRREIAKELWVHREWPLSSGAPRCIFMADELLAALEAREKEESK